MAGLVHTEVLNAVVHPAPLALIAALPLMGALLSYFIGQKAKFAAGWIATAASILSFLWVLKLIPMLAPGVILEDNLFQWISVGWLNVDFVFRFDHLSAVMCLVVTGVGSLIHLYSTAYMAEDESRPRFFSYLNLFMFSMLVLVLAGNLLVLFVGWEGVGLCSYLLIGFWFKNSSYAAAGRKAFVVNRIGDAGFLIGVFLLLLHAGTIDFLQLKAELGGAAWGQGGLSNVIVELVAFCLFIGAAGKSAQIPLFVWLPDAMAGPTPVSALIHAATMVTAGVYMMARLFFLFDLAPQACAIVAFIAVLTALVAALIAMTQNDIKKVLAYSTVSQLGFMFMAASVGAYWVAIYHVVTHAFFKACLFLSAGSVIHGCHHEQDMRHMGGLFKKMPLTALAYGISTLAIAGLAPLSGYYSKHAILLALEHNHNLLLSPVTGILVAVASLTAFFTAFYMTRSFAMTFLGSYRGHAHPHESPFAMTSVLVLLAALAAAAGVVLEGPLSLHHYLGAVMPVGEAHDPESFLAAIMHSWVGIVGVLLGLILYTQLASWPGKIYEAMFPISKLSSAKFYFDEIYDALIVKPLEASARFLWKVVDQGAIDAAVNTTAALVEVSGEATRITQTGQTRHYALFMFVATVLVLVFYFAI